MSAALTRVRALAPVAALAELWQRRDDESAEDYAAFMGWLDAGETRGGPAPGHAAIAARFEWAERALAYERAATTLAATPGGQTPEATIVTNLVQMVQIEVQKLLKQSASTHQPVVALKEILATIGLIKELQASGVAASTAAQSTAALEGLTVDEKRAILKFQLLQRKQK